MCLNLIEKPPFYSHTGDEMLRRWNMAEALGVSKICPLKSSRSAEIGECEVYSYFPYVCITRNYSGCQFI